MLPENPLEVPEIIGLVASYLKGKHLARCVQVSKGWRDLFLPYRWRTIRVGAKPTNYSHASRLLLGPRPKDIYSHRHLIHYLWISGKTNGLDKHHFPNLRKLTLKTDKVPQKLAKIFPSLVELFLIGPNMASNSWLAVMAHPSMTELTLCTQVIKAIDAPSFWAVCGRLDILSLSMITFGTGTIPALAGTVFDRLRRLEFEDQGNSDTSNQQELILRCPNLEELRWMDIISEFNNEHLTLDTERIREGHWHRLQELIIWQHFQDTQVASILNGSGVGSLTSLTLKDCHLEEQGSKALRPHFAALVYLEMQFCRSLSSSTIQDILCSCPRLEYLAAKGVFARDIVNGGPWVCQRLKELRIGFLFTESEQDLQREIFGRLSALTRLERMIMHIPEDESYDEEDILEFRMGNGLEQLATLRQMTSLIFERVSKNGSYVPQMGKDEVVWMLANWKKLKTLVGNLSYDSDEDMKLKLVLSLLDVRTEVW
ncbi:MAG: hypothetical protein J3Q66DRAFT_335008 [Benniella sp.]|nr:MAG: hypothetical protein J3Q66DRAFT_335008 [Benniella sp.]